MSAEPPLSDYLHLAPPRRWASPWSAPQFRVVVASMLGGAAGAITACLLLTWLAGKLVPPRTPSHPAGDTPHERTTP